MGLGDRLRTARLEAGLTQRQLCGEEITRNMLSQIENGSAKPSMKTLRYLAARLGKSVSYFLEEETVLSPNRQTMEGARKAFDDRDFTGALALLEQYQGPDPVYDREKKLLQALLCLELARQALEENRRIYARELLNRLDLAGCYCEEALLHRSLLLWGKLETDAVSHLLPSLDEELLLRAGEAFRSGNPRRAACLLDAAEDQKNPEWNLLRGQVYLAQTQYAKAAACLHRAEAAYPREVWFRLEHCYRELEDYKRAYEYACKQK